MSGSSKRRSSIEAEIRATYPELSREPSTVIATRNELVHLLNHELPPSEWHPVTQERVNTFAVITGDCNWIHTDPTRAVREGPYGGCVAHGYLSLSLLPMLIAEVVAFTGVTTVNYGLDRVRFPAPLFVGTSIRASVLISDVLDTSVGTRVALRASIESDASERPVCVADVQWHVGFPKEESR